MSITATGIHIRFYRVLSAIKWSLQSNPEYLIYWYTGEKWFYIKGLPLPTISGKSLQTNITHLTATLIMHDYYKLYDIHYLLKLLIWLLFCLISGKIEELWWEMPATITRCPLSRQDSHTVSPSWKSSKVLHPEDPLSTCIRRQRERGSLFTYSSVLVATYEVL